MQNVRSGNYGVVAANHTLILNWNDQTVPLLRQIALNRTERADDTYDGCAFRSCTFHTALSAVACPVIVLSVLHCLFMVSRDCQAADGDTPAVHL